MSKIEYEYELKDIKNWLQKQNKGLFEYWETYDSADRYVATTLCALVDLLITKELYQINQEKNEKCGKCGRPCCGKKIICHKGEKRK